MIASITGLAMEAALLVVPPPAVAAPVAKAAQAPPTPVSERPDATSAALSAKRKPTSPVGRQRGQGQG
ncbi:hypothetical protein OG320_22080 [Microbispora sp. NBC_01189]|uniref:hypothetical protein n=1 Tax=Microbispora sp. NBC_01189 TaxID=2903583 RepID=UPI002E13601D|nr:hypothetical protein OG320_22080 [Microbispora sp. NBC_01189]